MRRFLPALLVALVALALAAPFSGAEITRKSRDFDTFPPQHAYNEIIEMNCANGAETTAGDSNGWFRPAATAGAGATQGLAANSLGTKAGLCEFTASTTTSPTNTGLVTQSNLMNLANGTAKFFASFAEHTVSDGTNTYYLRVGLQDSTTTTDPTDGCYFLYSHGINGGEWLLVTHSNSSGGTNGSGGSNETTVDSNLAFADTTERQFGIIATSASCTFLSNGVPITNGVIATNIPSGSTRLLGAGIVFTKSSATTTATVPLYLDYMALKPARATPTWVPF